MNGHYNINYFNIIHISTFTLFKEVIFRNKLKTIIKNIFNINY